jgi:biopolymer transport protein ExbB/TolQ
MKKLAYVAILAIFVLGFIACGGASDDPKAVMNEFVDVAENFANKMESASTADDVAAALNTYSDEMEKLIPRMKELQEKHPELMNMKEAPEGYEEISERMEKVMTKFMTSMMQKLPQYQNEDVVKDALERFQQVSMQMK